MSMISDKYQTFKRRLRGSPILIAAALFFFLDNHSRRPFMQRATLEDHLHIRNSIVARRPGDCDLMVMLDQGMFLVIDVIVGLKRYEYHRRVSVLTGEVTTCMICGSQRCQLSAPG